MTYGAPGVPARPSENSSHGSNVNGSNGNNSNRAALYVNRGLGTFGFPVRLGVPPEITLLTLRKA